MAEAAPIESSRAVANFHDCEGCLSFAPLTPAAPSPPRARASTPTAGLRSRACGASRHASSAPLVRAPALSGRRTRPHVRAAHACPGSRHAPHTCRSSPLEGGEIASDDALARGGVHSPPLAAAEAAADSTAAPRSRSMRTMQRPVCSFGGATTTHETAEPSSSVSQQREPTEYSPTSNWSARKPNICHQGPPAPPPTAADLTRELGPSSKRFSTSSEPL